MFEDRFLTVKKHNLTIGFSPKCACVFLKVWWWFLAHNTKKYPWAHWGIHMEIRKIISEGRMAQITVDSYKVAGIRNPITRLQSAWADKLGNPNNKQYYQPTLTFEKWVSKLYKSKGDSMLWDYHWSPQIHVLEQQEWDMLIDIEHNLEESISKITDTLNLPKMEYSNIKTEKSKPKPNVTIETEAKIREIYKDDFEYLNKFGFLY